MESVKSVAEKAAAKAHEAFVEAAGQAKLNSERELESDRRMLEANIFRSFELKTFVLREKLAVQAVVNVFFLLNVDAYTRDDLMSMLAVKLSSSLLDPSLFLDRITAEALALLFQAMRISGDVLKDLGTPDLPIYPCLRTGQWLLSDRDYLHFLRQAASNPSKNAEPLNRIVKSMTIVQVDRHLVEEVLKILTALLGPFGQSASGAVGSARAAFSRALLELTNACFRAVYAENFSNDFVDGLRKQEPELKSSLSEQAAALERLGPWLAGTESLLPYHDRDVELQGWAQDVLLQASEDLLFEQLRILCVFQLQLVNVSAYSLTGEAVKLASLLTAADLTRELLPTYWLICFFEGLVSLGYTLEVLQHVLKLWKDETTLLLFSGSDAASLAAARQVFQRLRAILQSVGAGSEATPCFIHFFTEPKNVPNNSFRGAFADFLTAFVLRTRRKVVVKEGLEVTDKSAVATKRTAKACKERRKGPVASAVHDASKGIALLQAVSHDWADDPHVQEDHMTAQEVTQVILRVHSFFEQL